MAAGKRKESSSQSAAGAASPETSSKTPTSEKEVILRNGDIEYDVTSFLHSHPGGYISLMKYQGQDISNTMQNTHSPAARYLLASYSEKNMPELENMEHGINWERPMLSQVGNLGSRYAQWVENPVDKPLRLFHSNFVEVLTKTPWWVIPLVWIPVILIFLYSGWNKLATSDRWVTGLEMAICFSFGILMWTLIEYSLHRWLFHSNPPAWSPFLITAHFLIHGLHHKVPFDRHRLVFPPFPAAILTFILYNVASLFISPRILHVVVAGGITGYLIYDMIHYYLHYGSPAPDNYFYKMKRYHNKHHFSHQHTGFGISSDIWDRFFNTEIILNKLKITLKW